MLLRLLGLLKLELVFAGKLALFASTCVSPVGIAVAAELSAALRHLPRRHSSAGQMRCSSRKTCVRQVSSCGEVKQHRMGRWGQSE